MNVFHLKLVRWFDLFPFLAKIIDSVTDVAMNSLELVNPRQNSQYTENIKDLFQPESVNSAGRPKSHSTLPATI